MDYAALIEYTETALRVYCAVMLLFGAQIACQMTFISLGRAAESILVAVMRKFVLLLPLIYLMPLLLDDRALAVYAAEPVADLLAVTFTVLLFAGKFRRILRTLDQPLAVPAPAEQVN